MHEHMTDLFLYKHQFSLQRNFKHDTENIWTHTTYFSAWKSRAESQTCLSAKFYDFTLTSVMF